MLEGTSLNFVFIFLHFFKIHILFYPFVMTSYCLTFRQTTFACYYGFPNNKRKWSSRIILTVAHTLFFITCPEEFKLYTWKLLEGARCHTRGLISKGWKWETVSCEKKRSSLWGVQCMHLNSLSCLHAGTPLIFKVKGNTRFYISLSLIGYISIQGSLHRGMTGSGRMFLMCLIEEFLEATGF